ncbi:class I poly(R)-hydroxyalkanoic acid synthase [Geminicoccaceae bacterium 1502E]|nr:class I poly(R)-hydroxyalkanoic acid synthase [Geminicoccaceae bacterium 1502E]
MVTAGAEQQRAQAGLLQRVEEVGLRGQRLLREALDRRTREDDFQIPDPGIVAGIFRQLAEALLADPARLARAELRFMEAMGELWQRHQRRLAGGEAEPLVVPEPGDRRFKDPAWTEEPAFDLVRQAYLLWAQQLEELVAGVGGLDPATAAKARFYTRQLVDLASPSNAPLTNPQVLREALDTEGESLLRGLEHLQADLERGRGRLRLSTVRRGAFRLGRDIATTAGQVVFRNELMELIQYAPSTPQVRRRPLLIVPPWINKYYILDMRPQNSLVRWLVGQGFTVFLVSWVNPGRELAGKGFEDYMVEGPLAAMAAIEQATGERELLLTGYCIGGTLSACLLAWLAARGDGRVRAASFLTTMLDFSEPGELGVFIDEEQLALIERHMRAKGYLEAEHMQRVFSLMRANDLIWSFVVNNYLMGREPPAFDLLHWNEDGTRMPEAMHRFYLRSMYQRNLLARPGGIELAGHAIDLGRVKLPAYFLSTREDHIAPWASTWRGSRLLGGSVRFVLAGSGHIAGVVNPAGSGKYGYWLNAGRPAGPEAWLAGARRHEGSWWPDWQAWLARHAGPPVPARDPAQGGLEPLMAAPGSYVTVAAEDEDAPFR